MIEKLERYIKEEDGVKISCPPDNEHFMYKINEIIDYLESIRNIINVHEREIDQLQMSVTPEKCNYDDERKWIGKLCKFRDGEDFSWQYGILTDIVVGNDYPYWMGNVEFAECQPVLKEEFKDAIYKGEIDGK